MEKSFIVLTNHDLTDRQRTEAMEEFGCSKIVLPPQGIRYFWAHVPPRGELTKTGIGDVIDFLEKTSQTGDLVLVQGEFGATFFTVDYCFKKGLIPVYSTSERVYDETINRDGSVARYHNFKHIRFRMYSPFKEG